MKFKKGDIVHYCGNDDDWIANFTVGPYVILNPDFGLGCVEVGPVHGKFKYKKGNHHEHLGIYRLPKELLRLDVFLTAARKAVNGHPKKSPLHRKSKAS